MYVFVTIVLHAVRLLALVPATETIRLLQIDSVLRDDCYVSYICWTSPIDVEEASVGLVMKTVPFLRVLGIPGLRTQFLETIGVNSSLKIIFTDGMVWFPKETKSNATIYFGRDARQFMTSTKLFPVEPQNEPLPQSFQECFMSTCLQSKIAYQLTCNLSTIENMQLDRDVLTNCSQSSSITYLNLRQANILKWTASDFGILNQTLLRINLMKATINSYTKNFLWSFPKVHWLNLPDHLFGHDPNKLFGTLKRLVMVETRRFVYFPTENRSIIEKYDMRSRCFYSQVIYERKPHYRHCLRKRRHRIGPVIDDDVGEFDANRKRIELSSLLIYCLFFIAFLVLLTLFCNKL